MPSRTRTASRLALEGWAARAATAAGERLRGPFEQVRVRPWSLVLRAPAATGWVYAKATVPGLAHEADVLRLLSARRPDAVTELVAVEPAHGWMLLRDAGASVDGLAPSDALPHWERALPAYARLQLDMAGDASALAAAIPLARGTGELADCFDAMLADEPLLRVGERHGLTPDEYRRLHDLRAFVRAGCDVLAASPIPDTIQNDDLSAASVFVSGAGYRFVDWGDACVTFPFFTLTVTLRVIAYLYGLPVGAPELVRLRDAYLEPWTGHLSRAELRELDALARPLGQVCRAYAHYDAVRARRWDTSGEPGLVASVLRLVIDPEAWRSAA